MSARNRRVHNLRVPVESTANETLDIEPLRKGMHAWLHPARDGWSHHALLPDVQARWFGMALASLGVGVANLIIIRHPAAHCHRPSTLLPSQAS